MSSSFELSISADCSECGRSLNFETSVSRSGEISLSVEPCESCRDDAVKDETESLRERIDELESDRREADELRGSE